MLQPTLCPFAESSMPLITAGAVSKLSWMSNANVSLSASWIASRCSVGKSNVLRTRAGLDDELKALAKPSFSSPLSSRNPAHEHVAHPFFQACSGKVRERLPGDGEHLLARSACDFPGQTLLFASQSFLPFVVQVVSRGYSFIQESLAFRCQLFGRLIQE